MRFLLFMACMLLITACEKAKPPATPPIEKTEKHATFADPQIKAYNNAREVQGTLDAAEEKRESEMEADGL